MEDINHIAKCQCGAYTVHQDRNNWSMTEQTFKKLFPDLEHEQDYSNCNHCCNNWGIDICGCGSGEPVGECEGDFDECRNKTAFQILEEIQPSLIEVMQKRGGF